MHKSSENTQELRFSYIKNGTMYNSYVNIVNYYALVIMHARSNFSFYEGRTEEERKMGAERKVERRPSNPS
jgi:hypothetical protein